MHSSSACVAFMKIHDEREAMSKKSDEEFNNFGSGGSSGSCGASNELEDNHTCLPEMPLGDQVHVVTHHIPHIHSMNNHNGHTICMSSTFVGPTPYLLPIWQCWCCYETLELSRADRKKPCVLEMYILWDDVSCMYAEYNPQSSSIKHYFQQLQYP
jgi:hypothetical protein